MKNRLTKFAIAVMSASILTTVGCSDDNTISPAELDNTQKAKARISVEYDKESGIDSDNNSAEVLIINEKKDTLKQDLLVTDSTIEGIITDILYDEEYDVEINVYDSDTIIYKGMTVFDMHDDTCEYYDLHTNLYQIKEDGSFDFENGVIVDEGDIEQILADEILEMLKTAAAILGVDFDKLSSALWEELLEEEWLESEILEIEESIEDIYENYENYIFTNDELWEIINEIAAEESVDVKDLVNEIGGDSFFAQEWTGADEEELEELFENALSNLGVDVDWHSTDVDDIDNDAEFSYDDLWGIIYDYADGAGVDTKELIEQLGGDSFFDKGWTISNEEEMYGLLKEAVAVLLSSDTDDSVEIVIEEDSIDVVVEEDSIDVIENEILSEDDLWAIIIEVAEAEGVDPKALAENLSDYFFSEQWTTSEGSMADIEGMIEDALAKLAKNNDVVTDIEEEVEAIDDSTELIEEVNGDVLSKDDLLEIVYSIARDGGVDGDALVTELGEKFFSVAWTSSELEAIQDEVKFTVGTMLQ